MDGKISLLLPSHRDDDVVGEEALVGIDEFGAWFRDLIVTAGVNIDDLHGGDHAARVGSVAVGFEGRLGDGDHVFLLGLGWLGRVGKLCSHGFGEVGRGLGDC